jgi:segregation and condensation protein A
MANRTLQTLQGEDQEGYRVQLSVFEGPLDLLLHLIKKSEINIYDIPIALIARQYLDYLEAMKSFNLNIAGEFLVMAATLIHIKSKMLLPPEDLQEEEQEEDPRADLVRKLMEYQQFKDAGERLRWKEELWSDVFRREGDQTIEAGEEVMLSEVSLFDLMEALQIVLRRIPKGKVLEIAADELSVRERMSLVMERLEKVDGLPFEELFEGESVRSEIIAIFLALLELIRLRLVLIQQIKLFGPIYISRTTAQLEIDEAGQLQESDAAPESCSPAIE